MIVEEFEQVRVALQAEAEHVAASLTATQEHALAAVDAAVDQARAALATLDERVRAEIAQERAEVFAAVHAQAQAAWTDDEPWAGPPAPDEVGDDAGHEATTQVPSGNLDAPGVDTGEVDAGEVDAGGVETGGVGTGGVGTAGTDLPHDGPSDVVQSEEWDDEDPSPTGADAPEGTQPQA
ncbi:hypothetical protein [Cellulomonas oligotrophica]|uniref:Uncharacterized protein n=1 Tax=Cellulomonas oligotrophica TaxID=931536 RepID=A0A7Y9FGC7_9CELL|nr:hypothetical protein [Cellulomonas oligotrophica]NYD86859.1 hypothetical protein [Cellulomonas oligotrophica]GIG32355.1 hypothetical protein Col01nite_15140 [Cellulomonas oligotrophica]